jgi:hypothetical protein
MMGSEAKTVTGAVKIAAIADRMTKQDENLNVDFMIHLPSRPKRQIIDQWKNIILVDPVRTANFLKQQPTLSKSKIASD